MGKNVVNTEFIKDYRTNKQCFRIHLDIPLNQKLAAEVRQYLEDGELDKVKKTLKAVVDPSARRVVDGLPSTTKKTTKRVSRKT